MPRLSTPPDMPRGVTAAIEIIGNRVRARVIRHLASAGPSTAPQVAAAIGARREIVYRHLEHLELAGLVTADEPADRRHGRLVHWSIQLDRLRLVVDELADYLAGK